MSDFKAKSEALPDGKRVPLVRLFGRWLETLDFQEGAKFAAVDVEGGLLGLCVYEAAQRIAPTHRVQPILTMIHFRPTTPRDLLAPLFTIRSAP